MGQKVYDALTSVNLFHRFLFFLGCLIVAAGTQADFLYGQTAGQIYKPAGSTEGRSILDPSDTGNVFTNGINFHPLSQLQLEPTGDPRTGATGGHSELIRNSGNDSPSYMYYDSGNDALLFRVRLGGQSKASKGYSFLFNTDVDVFGPKANNFTKSNPGFQFEVVLQTGHGVTLYDHENDTETTLPGGVEPYMQKAIAEGGNGFFYDFYVPLDEIDDFLGGNFATADFRVVASTITSAKSGISGTISDISGIDDDLYKSTTSALVDYIEASPEVGVNSLNQMDNLVPRTPSIFGPLLEGSNITVEGSSRDEDVRIDVYVNGSQETSTSSISDNDWSVTLDLSEGDKVYAVAVRNGNESDPSTTLTVGMITSCTAAPSNFTRSGTSLTGEIPDIEGVELSGGLPTNLIIRVYQNDGSLYASTSNAESGGTVYAAEFDDWDNSTDAFDINRTNNSDGNIFNGISSGFYVTAQVDGQCESDYSGGELGGIDQTEAPVITTEQILVSGSTTTISGTRESNAEVFLYMGSQLIGTADAASSTSWSIDVSGDTFVEGQQVSARAQITDEQISDQSNIVFVGEIEQTTEPIIEGEYFRDSGVTVEGVAFEAQGTTINVFVDGTLAGSTDTDLLGNWELAGVDLSGASEITATAEAEGKSESEESDAVEVKVGQTNPPNITTSSPVNTNEDQIQGNLASQSSGGTIRIYVDNEVIATVENASSNWTASINPNDIYDGAEIYATYQRSNRTESDPSGSISVEGVVLFIGSTGVSPDPVSGGGGRVVELTFLVSGSDFEPVGNGEVTVNFSIDSGNGSLSSSSADTDADGEVTVSYTTVSGDDESTVKIQADAMDGSDVIDSSVASFEVEEESGDPPPEIATDGLTPADDATDVASGATVSVEFDQDVSISDGSDVTIVGADEGTVGNISASLEGDNRTLTISHDAFGGSEEVYTVTVPSGTVQNSDAAVNAEITWSFTTAASGDPEPVVTSITVSGDGTFTIPSDGSSQKTYTAQVLDQSDDEMGSEDVTWSLASSVTGVSIDASSGVVTVTDAASAGTFTVVATSDTDGDVTGDLEVTLTAEASAVTSITVSGDDTFTIPSDGSSQKTYTAQVLDQFDDEMGSEDVTWSLAASVGGVSIDGSTGVVTVTDAASAGTFTVVATSDTDGDVTGDLEVTLSTEASAVTSITVSGDDTFTIPSDGSSQKTYTAQVLDQFDDEMGSEDVTWSLAASVGGVSIDGSTGVVTVTDAASTGTFTVVATSDTDGDVSGDLEVTLSAAASVVTSITVSGDDTFTIPSDGSSQKTYTAQVLDQSDDEMGSEDVTWSLASAVTGVSIDASTGVVTVNDEASAGTFTVVATSDTDGDVTGSLEVTMSLADPVVDGDNSSVTADPTSLTVGSTSEVTVLLKDQYDSALTGVTDFDIQLGGSAEISEAIDEDDGTPGTYIFSVTNETAEQITVSVEANSVSVGSDDITFNLGGVSATVSDVTVTTPHTADGADASTVTIQLKDEFENSITGLDAADFDVNLAGQSETEETIEVTTDIWIRSTQPNTTHESDAASVRHESVSGDTRFGIIEFDLSSIDPDALKSAELLLKALNANGTIGQDAFLIDTRGKTQASNITWNIYQDEYDGEEIELETIGSRDSGTAGSDGDEVTMTASKTDLGRIQNVIDSSGKLTFVLKPNHSSTNVDWNDDVVDGHGNGARLTLTFNSSNASAGGISETSTPGTYTFDFTNTTAEVITVEIEADNVTLNESPEVTFNPGDINSIHSTVYASPTELTVGGTSVVTVVARDEFNNPIGGITDFDMSPGGDASVSEAISETGTAGTYSFEVTNSKAETVEVEVESSSTSLGTAQIEFTPDVVHAAQSSVEADPTTLAADGTTASTLTITLRDEFDNLLNGKSGDLNVSQDGSADLGSISESGTGVYTLQITNTKAESVTISTEIDDTDLDDQPELTFTAGSISAENSSVTADPDELVVGNSSVVTVILRDENDNLVSGITDFDIGLGDTDAEVDDAISEDEDEPGNYQFSVTNTVNEEVTVTVEASSQELEDKPALTFLPGEGFADNSSASVPDGTAGEETEITITVLDEFDNPVTGAEEDLSLSIDGPNDGVEFSDIVDNGDGTYTVSYTPTAAGTDEISIVLDGDAIDDSPYTSEVSSGTGVADNSSAEVPGGVAGEKTEITITVLDAHDNPVSGVADDLSISVSGANEGVEFSDIVDNGDGTYTVSYTPTASGTDEISITLDDDPISDNPYESEVAAGAAAKLQIQEQPKETVAGQPIEGPPSVLVTDANDNPVPDIEVEVELKGDTDFDDGSEAVKTSADGTALFSDLAINRTGSYTLVFSTGELDENINSDSFKVIAAEGVADNTDAEVPDGAAGEVTEITITVLDEFGNPVTGAEEDLSLSIDGPNEGAEFTDIIDHGDGTYTVSYTPTAAGLDKINISLDGESIDDSPFSSEVIPAPAASLVLVDGNDQKQPTRSWLDEPLTVRVLDKLDNPVIGEEVTFEFNSQPGGAVDFELSDEKLESDEKGIVSLQAKLGSEPGTYRVTARTNDPSIDPVQFTMQADAVVPNPSFVDEVNTVVFGGGLNTYMFAEFSPTLDQPSGFNLETWVLPNSLDSDGVIASRWDEENPAGRQYRIRINGNTVTIELVDDEGRVYEIVIADFFRILAQNSDGHSSPMMKKVELQDEHEEKESIYEWTHISLVVDPDHERIQLYKDGFELKRMQLMSALQPSNSSLEVGRGFDGEVHEVRLWDRPRARSEIQALKDLILTGNEDNLVLYHTFDEDATVDHGIDSTPNGNDFFFGEDIGRRLRLRNVSRVTMHQNEDFIIRLAALDETGGSIRAEVMDLPENGRLLQLNENLESTERITQAGTAISESLNRSLYIPDEDFAGIDQIRYKIYDQHGNFATSVMEFEVLVVNRPPVVSDIGILEIQHGDSLRVGLDTLVTDHVYTPEDMTWEVLLPEGVVAKSKNLAMEVDHEKRELLITAPKLLRAENIRFMLRASDPEGLYGSREFGVTVHVPVTDYDLRQNYPNPFRDVPTIGYSVPVSADVTITVYDILGRRISTIVDEQRLPTGYYEKQWNAGGLASGVYFYRMAAKGEDGSRYEQVKQMTLIK